MSRTMTALALATVWAVGFAGGSSSQEGGTYSDQPPVLWGSPLTNTTGRAAGLAAFNVSEEGAIEVIVDGQKAVIKSTFSSLGQQSSFGGGVGAGNWSPVQIDRPREGAVRVRGTGTVFSIERWIFSAPLDKSLVLCHSADSHSTKKQYHGSDYHAIMSARQLPKGWMYRYIV